MATQTKQKINNIVKNQHSNITHIDDNSPTNTDKLPDVVQTSILLDVSGSMSEFSSALKSGAIELVKQHKDGILSIQTFNRTRDVIQRFGEYSPQAIERLCCDGCTYIYSAISDMIDYSLDEASITSEIKTHHVFVIFTDGRGDDDDNVEKCIRKVNQIAKDATFFIVGFGDDVCIDKGLKFKILKRNQSDKVYKQTLAEISNIIKQVESNVYRKLLPQTNLLLPPSR